MASRYDAIDRPPSQGGLPEGDPADQHRLCPSSPESEEVGAPCERAPQTPGQLHRIGQTWRRLAVVALIVGVTAAVAGPLVIGFLQESEPPAPQPPEVQTSQPPTTQASRDVESLVATSPFVLRDPGGRLSWPRPRTEDRQRERDRMVDTQIARGGYFHDAVDDAGVIAAMRAVPRHQFVPENRQSSAYDDTPLPIGHGQTISQPYIVALMTELLAVREGDRVLEVGTGSGYQAAILNELTPFVWTIEIVEPLHKQVTKRFEKLGYKTIQTRFGDGYDGWRENAPYDGIIVTCAAGHVPPPLWEELKEGGRMVIPVGGVYDTQRLIVLTKEEGGKRSSRNVLPVRFVPMTGKIERP